MADESMNEFKWLVDSELWSRRPDRYDAGDPALIDAVVEAVKDEVPILDAREIAARTIVGQREGQATKRVNRFLKGIAGHDGQYALPVDWYLHEREPVALDVPIIENGEPVGHKRIRVALGEMRPEDWRVFSAEGRQDALERYDAEIHMYDCADWVASEQGARSFSEWAEKVAPKPKDAAA